MEAAQFKNIVVKLATAIFLKRAVTRTPSLFGVWHHALRLNIFTAPELGETARASPQGISSPTVSRSVLSISASSH